MKSPFASELAALYARDLTRLAQELGSIGSAAAVWQVAPGITNPAGTLALHLEGNLREYVGRQLGGRDYRRDRPLEFSARDVDRAELIRRIEAVREMVTRVIDELTPASLEALIPEPFAGRTMAARELLMHLYGHLNYHLGQVDYVRRVVTGEGAIPLAG
jgi:hypothetical protein